MVRYRFYSLIISVIIMSCLIGTVRAADDQHQSLLLQDLNALKDSNGKIVKQTIIEIKSQLGDRVTCYRIKYLSDGLLVVGFIIRPKSGDSKFPVLIFNRGGNREFAKIDKKKLKYLAYLASFNYVVMASQYRGSDGGEGHDEFGGRDIHDVLNLIPLAKSLSFTDPNKIVMLGVSRGGMMTYVAIKEDANIKAAAVVSGVTDLFQSYKETEGKTIKELVGMDRNEWEKRSAYYWPEKINIPVIILHGGADTRIGVNQARKLARKLKKLGKVHKLIIYPQGDHALNNCRSKRDKEILKWFETYLH